MSKAETKQTTYATIKELQSRMLVSLSLVLISLSVFAMFAAGYDGHLMGLDLLLTPILSVCALFIFYFAPRSLLLNGSCSIVASLVSKYQIEVEDVQTVQFETVQKKHMAELKIRGRFKAVRLSQHWYRTVSFMTALHCAKPSAFPDGLPEHWQENTINA